MDPTLAAYEARVDRYLAAHGEPPAAVVAWSRRFAALLPGPRVLELGSGPGTDADRLEALGAVVQRSDATPAFVRRLRALGHPVLDLDVRTATLPRPLEGVFANAVLLHLERAELSAALAAIRDALVPGGVLGCTLKEGDGDEWHDRKLGLPRHFVYWRPEPLRATIESAGLTVVELVRSRGATEDWLQVVARRD